MKLHLIVRPSGGTSACREREQRIVDVDCHNQFGQDWDTGNGEKSTSVPFMENSP